MFRFDVDYIVISMLLAVRSRLSTFDIEGKCPRDCGVRATPGADINHAIIIILLTVSPCIDAFDVEGGCP